MTLKFKIPAYTDLKQSLVAINHRLAKSEYPKVRPGAIVFHQSSDDKLARRETVTITFQA